MHTAPSGKPPSKEKEHSHYVRWRFDPNASNPRVEPRELVAADGEMPKVDDRFVTKKYNTLFLAMHDPNKEQAPVGSFFNAIARCDINTGQYEYWSAGSQTALHEVAFVPRSDEGTLEMYYKSSTRCSNPS